ncbi:MAG TPA: PP2C family protein-serine/threonine phosphatase [Edaphobacter sp.]|nr:PP2C family protein-serine/threonine phosphatase [Edaphobacter sp.]
MELSETLVAQQQVVRLQALLEASRQIHSTIQLDEVLCIALRIVVRELELTGAFFTSFDRSYGDVPAELMQHLSLGPDTEAAIDKKNVLLFSLCDKNGNRFTDLAAILPAGRTLTIDEIDFLEALSMQASVAIENARFHERTVQWQRLESDLASARLVQQSLLPERMPEIPRYALAARSITCYEVGGDYLDVISLPSGEIIAVVGDVAGKGLTSALVGMSFRAAFRAMVHSGLPMAEIATQMNQLHYSEGAESRRRYVTAFLLRLDPAADTIEVVNAGHNPALLLPGDGECIKIVASGTPIGMLPFSSYHAEKYVLAPSARLLIYTDGLTEVFREQEEFGETRLLQTFSACKEASPDAAITALWNTLTAFSDEPTQSDDMTAFMLFHTS